MASTSEQSTVNKLDNEKRGRGRGFCQNIVGVAKKYQPLYRAIDENDWNAASDFFDRNEDAIRTGITDDEDIPLLQAVKKGRDINFLKKLLQNMLKKDLQVANAIGSTALHAAAVRGNTKAGRLFVERNDSLPFIPNYGRSLPLHLAAMRGKREMTKYLFDFMKEKDKKPFEGASGSSLLDHLINARFYDMAFELLRLNSQLAYKSDCPLKMMASEPSAFPSGLRFSFWQGLIYSFAPHYEEDFQIPYNGEDEENQADRSQLQQKTLHGFPKLYKNFWNVFERIVPHIKHIQDTKLLVHERVKLVHHICKEVVRLDDSEAYSILEEPFLLAAKSGIHEVIEVISREFPSAIGFKDEDNHTAFQLAIMYRHENVFNFINQSGDHDEFLSDLRDNKGNNILHLAGYLAHENRLNLMSPVILQVQRELQWYKEVEKLVLPGQIESKNNDKKTPLMVFIDEHSNMVTNEEQWMKGMANSCTVAATLIGGVAFAAAVTIPGGNNEEDFPFLTKEASFMIFNISNTLALFSSLSTMIIFLAILISRYAVNDFLYALPRRLVMGLISLFFSITSMIISFSAAIYLVSPHRKVIIILAALFACVPVILFLFLQFPLLFDIIKSTYFPRIFMSQKSNKES